MTFKCNKRISLNSIWCNILVTNCILKQHKCHIKTEGTRDEDVNQSTAGTNDLFGDTTGLVLAHLQVSIDSLLSVLLEILGTGSRIVRGGTIVGILSGGLCLTISILGGGRSLVGVILGRRRSLVPVVLGRTGGLVGGLTSRINIWLESPLRTRYRRLDSIGRRSGGVVDIVGNLLGIRSSHGGMG
jgi:hypothetical protein